MCNTESKSCAYGECGTCKATAIPTLRLATNDALKFHQWATESISSDKDKKSIITVKKECTMTEDETLTAFQEWMVKFKSHLFNIRWQYRAYRELRENLLSHECLLHIDFSENYVCKYSDEVQSVHFGGSHQQATLHTGVLYTAQSPPLPFCSISPSRRHDPPAIWAHLHPVLDMIRERFPDVSCLHFFSDGPATQYRQKGNFFLLSSEPFRRGFNEVTWSFFEASHGKGTPDGVEGTLKRSADRLVCMGIDIPSAEMLYLKLKEQESAVQLFFTREDSVETKVHEMLQLPPLTAIKGTMRVHQVLSKQKGKILYRDVSCFCRRQQGVIDCPCYELKEAVLQEEEAQGKEMMRASRPEVFGADHVGRWVVVELWSTSTLELLLGWKMEIWR
ncbi:hypothetical protein ACEWY4_007716 [Coilia grayii]|uniref:Uncharacterized protein n=1 Tax=Coilia grayii TaxID=363190 RepID=A0ABD1K9J1_9TELE